MSFQTADRASIPARQTAGRLLAAPVALLVVLAAMTVLLAVAHRVMLRQSREWVNHTHEVIENTQQLFSYTLDIESSTRGFLLAADPRLLDTYDSGRAAFPATATRLRRLVSDNPAETARVDRLITALAQRITLAVERVTMARQGHLAQARGVLPHNDGKNAMDEARRIMVEVLRTENALLAQRTASADRDEMIGFAIALAISGLSLAGLATLILSMVETNRRMAHEISEREAAEAAQRKSQALYRAIFANAADYIYVIDISPEKQLSVVEFNPAFEQATGWTTAERRGQGFESLKDYPLADAFATNLRRLLKSDRPVFSRDPVSLRDGPRIWETVLIGIRNEQGRIERIVGTARDVTDREQAEEQLRRAQRMEAIGHLTGGVAHDFNNLLQVIRGNLELLAPLLQVQDPALQRVKNALHGADRAAQLTRQLLAFARRQPLEPKVVNLGRLVTDMTDMLRRTLGESIEIETVIAGGLWNTMADPAQVESALLNLAINARDAMPSGGKLTVEITNAVLDQGYANRDAEVEPGQYVLLAVSDTGQGMSKETLARVFEPFFTTKAEEKGTGLGLSMVYGFVKQSKGHVQIYSEVAQGTTVKIYLPRAHLPEDQIVRAATGSLRGGSEVILVVEDDDMVRNSAVGILRDLGYACLHAADGAAALEILKSGAKVDLLFTDVIMPGPVKSRDLANEALALRPRLPVLFTSGYTENAIVHHGRLDEGVQLLSKPYTRDDLARRIRGLLQSARPVVLVVEDDGLVRMSAVDMVESLGFIALEASEADAALAILRRSGRVDILFTDVGLPGMRGPQLAREAATLRPDLRIIFASGYGETEETASMAGAAHLGKPYEQDQLAEVLSAAVT